MRRAAVHVPFTSPPLLQGQALLCRQDGGNDGPFPGVAVLSHCCAAFEGASSKKGGVFFPLPPGKTRYLPCPSVTVALNGRPGQALPAAARSGVSFSWHHPGPTGTSRILVVQTPASSPSPDRLGRPVSLRVALSLCPGIGQWRMDGPQPAPRVLSRDGTIKSLLYLCFSWVHVLDCPVSCSYDIWFRRICQEVFPGICSFFSCKFR
jgi:hypothetical protein